jgi:hypothetical protein
MARDLVRDWYPAALFGLPGRRRWGAWVTPCDAKTNLGVLFGSPQRQFQGMGQKLDHLIGWQRWPGRET